MEQDYIRVGAGAIIIKDNMILLAKRKGSYFAGMWGSFGGSVEFNETPADAVKREAREELGIEVGNIKFITCADMVVEGKHVIDISFTADIISGEPSICEPDFAETVGWFPLDNLPSPLFYPVKIGLEALKTGQKYFEIKE